MKGITQFAASFITVAAALTYWQTGDPTCLGGAIVGAWCGLIAVGESAYRKHEDYQKLHGVAPDPRRQRQTPRAGDDPVLQAGPQSIHESIQ